MRNRGVTLIEVMVVVALIGIIGSLAVTTTEGLRGRTAPRNAAADFSTMLSQARARATERGADVWVIIYPNRGPTSASMPGNGAWFIYEDPDVNFGKSGSGSCDGSTGHCNFANFNPPNAIYPPPPSATSQDRLLEREYLDRAAKKNVTFGNSSDPTVLFGPPFGSAGTGLNAGSVQKDCSFCTGTGIARRGAIVFNGDGAARFVDGSGNPVWESMGALSLQAATAGSKQVTLFGISATTGYVGVFQ